MKRLLLFALLLLPFISKAQPGFLNLNDFGPPTYPYPYSRYWLRGTPLGTVPILTIAGTKSFKIHCDTVFINQLSLREDANPFKLVWIGQDSMLRAITPPYLNTSDTTLMLSPYIRALNASTIYYPVTNPAGYITSASIAGKVNISDTASMLSPYIRAAQAATLYYPLVTNPAGYLTTASIAGKVNVSDTAAMLSPYLKSFLLRKTETFLGSSDASGNYTVAYGASYPSTPDVQPQLQTGIVTQSVRITASSTTGFTVNITNRAVTSLLGIDLISGTATVVNGASVSVLVTAR